MIFIILGNKTIKYFRWNKTHSLRMNHLCDERDQKVSWYLHLNEAHYSPRWKKNLTKRIMSFCYIYSIMLREYEFTLRHTCNVLVVISPLNPSSSDRGELRVFQLFFERMFQMYLHIASIFLFPLNSSNSVEFCLAHDREVVEKKKCWA